MEAYLHNVVAVVDSLSAHQVQSYGRWLTLGFAAFYMANSVRRDVPADTQYAIEAHLPQGYDRSIISARLEQRHTKQLLNNQLKLTQLHEQLRSETSREGKLRLWGHVLHENLVALVAAAYTHSLSLNLFVMKNTVRVIIFLLRRREAQLLQRRGKLLTFSVVRSWWSRGTRSLVMESMLQRLNERVALQASPFEATPLEGLDTPPLPTPPPLDGRDAFVASQRDTAAPEATAAMHAFSVRATLARAVPRIVAAATRAVDRVLQRKSPHAFSMTGVVTAAELRSLLADVAQEFERHACVAEWLWPSPAAASSTAPVVLPLTQRSNTDAGETEGLQAVEIESASSAASATAEDDVVEFPAGTSVLLGADGRPLRADGPHDLQVLDGIFQRGMEETAEERAARAEEQRREHIAQEQSAGFYQELITSASFGELCMQYASEVLQETIEAASDLSAVKSYDASTDSAKVLLMTVSLEGHRRRLFDADFDVRPFVRVFCDETLRSTCS